jgi:hypothetical protein
MSAAAAARNLILLWRFPAGVQTGSSTSCRMTGSPQASYAAPGEMQSTAADSLTCLSLQLTLPCAQTLHGTSPQP